MVHKKGVAIFVDYENIRRCLKNFYDWTADPGKISDVLIKAAKDNGKVFLAKVFGDWSLPYPGMASVPTKFQTNGFEPQLVLLRSSKKGDIEIKQDRSDIAIALESIDTLNTKSAITVFMFVTGDGDFREVASRVKQAGKEVIICGVGPTIHRSLFSLADLIIPLENLLGLAAPEKIEEPEESAKPLYNWPEFIRTVHTAELMFSPKKGKFISFKHFRNKWLRPVMGPVDSFEDRHELMNQAIKLRIILTYKVPNPTDPERPETLAIKLNKSHDLVSETLKKTDKK